MLFNHFAKEQEQFKEITKARDFAVTFAMTFSQICVNNQFVNCINSS